MRHTRRTLLALVLTTIASSSARAQDPGDAGPALRAEPAHPVRGTLFAIVVAAADGAPPLVHAEGRAGDEPLHFRPRPDGTFLSLAAADIEADTVRVVALVRDAQGREHTLAHRVVTDAGAYEHERLRVAPRFGRPPDSAQAARLARERAKARAVAAAAHRTPRLYGDTALLPRRARVTSGFGNGRVFNGQVSSRHMGLDLAGRPGDTVRAPTRGVVALVDTFSLAGRLVYLNHGDGLVSAYFHLTRPLVAVGDTVTDGAPIGLVGATGRVTGPHLHWVVRYGNTSVDPRSLLARLGGAPPP